MNEGMEEIDRLSIFLTYCTILNCFHGDYLKNQILSFLPSLSCCGVLADWFFFSFFLSFFLSFLSFLFFLSFLLSFLSFLLWNRPTQFSEGLLVEMVARSTCAPEVREANPFELRSSFSFSSF